MGQFLFTIDPKELRRIIHEELKLVLQQNNSPPQKEETEFLDINEAAMYLKISPHSLRKLCQKQSLPCYKRFNKWLFKKEELNAYIEEGKQLSITQIKNNTYG